MIHSTSLVETQQIGQDTRIWQFCVILPEARIGKNCNINCHVFIENDVVIGDNVTIKSGVQIWDGLRIEDDVFIGPNVSFTNDFLPRSKKPPAHFVITTIQKGASIGANSTILCGITIGRNAMIGAGSVVTKNIPDYSLWYGNPATRRGFVCGCGVKLTNDLHCGRCDLQFRLDLDGGLIPSPHQPIQVRKTSPSIFSVERYKPEDKQAWDGLIRSSKNGTFLFLRDYMEYHSNRFVDHSLCIRKKNALYAVIPANVRDDIAYSHQGLTYGGLVTLPRCTADEVLKIFSECNRYFREEGVKKVVYKPVPYIYCAVPAQEDLYALFRLKARLIGRSLSSVIDQRNKFGFHESRKWGVDKARKAGLKVTESSDFAGFWAILESNLKGKFNTLPVHSLEEIQRLRTCFVQNIRLFITLSQDEMLAGAVLYISGRVVHVQYISSSEKGRNLGALDLLFDHLVNTAFKNEPFFDFGGSTEKMGAYLNGGLIFQKEGFGGRGLVYDAYEYDTDVPI